MKTATTTNKTVNTFVTGQEVGSEVEGFWFRLPPALVVTVETFPAASLHLIKLHQRMESTTLDEKSHVSIVIVIEIERS